ncbi:CYTH domain-containing protein [Ureibacillus sp. MALMAid1270]|uniref:CYTH domain-containing protein n=1 Tax=Ureibacillus sp. MALMAid1270 TaxID=3411629 RepID=UPI003BA46B0F
MSQEIEIEYKNLLTKEQYEMLLIEFKIDQQQVKRQTNHYFDTPQWHLRKLSSGLRIRETASKIVCTLKEKTSEHTHLETTDRITAEEAALMLNGKEFHAPSVKSKLQQLQVPIQELKVFGTLTTDRVEIPYENGLLVLDHSFYLNSDDYEVEYETNDEIIGSTIFNKFLLKYNIEQRKTDKKIARFMNALQSQKG